MTKWEEIKPFIDEGLTMVTGEAVMLAIGFNKNDQRMTRFMQDCEAKFAAGQAEHNDDWVGWSNDDYRREMREELIDAVIYMASLCAKVYKEES